MATIIDNFDADINQSWIDSNIDMVEEFTNTCEYDLDSLTIFDTNDYSHPDLKYGESCGILMDYMQDLDMSNLCYLEKI